MVDGFQGEAAGLPAEAQRVEDERVEDERAEDEPAEDEGIRKAGAKGLIEGVSQAAAGRLRRVRRGIFLIFKIGNTRWSIDLVGKRLHS